MSTKDGGAAFPQPENGTRMGDEGMTLRDYFAAKALQAMIGKNPATVDNEYITPEVRSLVRGAYSYADAMLSERAK
jgi:hypothetical protein